MIETPPAIIAERYLTLLDPHQKGSFAHLREAYHALVPAARIRSVGPGNCAAIGMVVDLIERAVEDVTRAVPWDTADILKGTRKEVIALIKEAMEILVEFDEDECGAAESLATLGQIRFRYLDCIEELNERDRCLLIEPIGVV